MSDSVQKNGYQIGGNNWLNNGEQAGAELGQAQVKLDDIIVIVVEVVVQAMVEVDVQHCNTCNLQHLQFATRAI